MEVNKMSNNKKRKQPPQYDSDEENKSSYSNDGGAHRAKKLRRNPTDHDSKNENSENTIKSSLPYIDFSDSQKESEQIPQIQPSSSFSINQIPAKLIISDNNSVNNEENEIDLNQIKSIKEEEDQEEEDNYDWLQNSEVENMFCSSSRVSETPGKKIRQQYDHQEFENTVFRVDKMFKSENYNTHMELKLTPPLDQWGNPTSQPFVECPIIFKLRVCGKWNHQNWAEEGDLVRVIGKFCPENKFSLVIDDNEEDDELNKASLLIVEPFVLVPTTQITKAFPCSRSAILGHQYKGLNGDVNYALVLGNVVHNVFQQILDSMDFKSEKLDIIIRSAIQAQLLSLYCLKKTEQEVYTDAEKGVMNITKWLSMVFFANRNEFSLKYEKFIAAEQEFNTNTYGIKGNIDCTVVVKDREGIPRATALEIKTGKHKSLAYRGQVLLYSLLISERFINSNPDNILLFIMDDNLKDGFQYLKQTKHELDQLVIGRNEIAKWNKRNNYNPLVPQRFITTPEKEWKDEEIKEMEQIEQIDLIRLPPMITRPSYCQTCFQKQVCTISALSFESKAQRKPQQGQFPTFLEMEKSLTPQVKEYFKKFIECISLEQNSENDRNNKTSQKEVNLRMTKLEDMEREGVRVYLEKETIGVGELQEQTFVNMFTIDNITFSKGYIAKREIIKKNEEEVKIDKDLVKNEDHSEEEEKVGRNSKIPQQSSKKLLKAKLEAHTIQYTVEFTRIWKNNLTALALGERDPYQLPWTIEIEPFSSFSFGIMKQNVLSLCLDEQFLWQRDAIIHLKAPEKATFSDLSFFEKQYSEELKNLNGEQKWGVLKSICAKNYHMILGTPGSGKTTSIVALIKILAKMKKRVLLVNFTNVAVDNVMIRLKESGFNKFIRVTNNISSVDEYIKDHVRTTSFFENMNQIKQTIENNYVFGTTCLQMNHSLLYCMKFDYCIMDEASQISEPLAIGPILLVDKFVMIGDFYQLNPLVKSFLAERKGMGVSLFERLCHAFPDHLTIFKRQYRMNKDILELSNAIIYKGQMTFGNQDVALQSVTFPHENNSYLAWLEGIKSRSVTFLKTDKIINSIKLTQRSKFKYKNYIEAGVVSMIVDNFIQSGIDPTQITVIAPFLEQQFLLSQNLKKYAIKKVMTIDRCQGIDCDIVILSCTKQSPEKGMLLKDLRRLNVALTRAKKMLVIIGTEQYLKEIKPFDQITEKLNQEKWVEEIKTFDQQMRSYLPVETSQFINLNDIAVQL